MTDLSDTPTEKQLSTQTSDHVHAPGCGCTGFGRRGLMGLAVAGAATLAMGASTATARETGGALTAAQRDALKPQDVLRLVMEGNERFATGKLLPKDYLRQQKQAAVEGQHPAAVFLTCVDSRAPVEVLCDLGIGDAFNARVAGNVVNDDILGSMEFATAAAGAKLVMVMGHTACGAVAGAIDNVRLGNLTLLLSRFGNAIAATPYEGEKSGKNYDFVDRVAATQVKQTLTLIRDRSPVLRDLEQDGKILIVGSMYDLKTGRVTLL
jgi:carbonic anhydrase